MVSTRPEPALLSSLPTSGRFQDAATFVLIALVVLLHVQFAWRGIQLPHDFGAWYSSLPAFYLLSDGGSATFSHIVGAFFSPGGWYECTLAVWLHIFGRSPLVLQCADAFLVGLLVLLVALISRAIGGSNAGLAAAALASAMPAIVTVGRKSWIHTPETVLLLLVLLSWVRDPSHSSRRWRWITGTAGLLALLLSSSAMFWIIAMGGAMMLGFGGKQNLPRFLVPGVMWAAGVAFNLVHIALEPSSFLGSLGSVPGDETPVLVQFLLLVGPFVLGIIVFGVALRFKHTKGRVEWLLMGWTILPFILLVVLRRDLSHFTPGFAALAILAGCGLAREAVNVLPAAVLGLAVFSPAWPSALLDRASGGLGDELRAEEFKGLIDAVCPDTPEGCLLAAAQGVFRPFSEGTEHLEFFLLRMDRVRVVDIREALPRPLPGVDLLLHYNCGEPYLRWKKKYPRSPLNLAALVRTQNLRPVWGRPVYQGCRIAAYSPSGETRHPELLPSGDVNSEDDFLASPDIPAAPLGDDTAKVRPKPGRIRK